MFKWIGRRVSRRRRGGLKPMLDLRTRFFRTREEVERLLEIPVLATYKERKDR